MPFKDYSEINTYLSEQENSQKNFVIFQQKMPSKKILYIKPDKEGKLEKYYIGDDGLLMKPNPQAGQADIQLSFQETWRIWHALRERKIAEKCKELATVIHHSIKGKLPDSLDKDKYYFSFSDKPDEIKITVNKGESTQEFFLSLDGKRLYTRSEEKEIDFDDSNEIARMSKEMADPAKCAGLNLALLDSKQSQLMGAHKPKAKKATSAKQSIENDSAKKSSSVDRVDHSGNTEQSAVLSGTQPKATHEQGGPPEVKKKDSPAPPQVTQMVAQFSGAAPSVPAEDKKAQERKSTVSPRIQELTKQSGLDKLDLQSTLAPVPEGGGLARQKKAMGKKDPDPNEVVKAEQGEINYIKKANQAIAALRKGEVVKREGKTKLCKVSEIAKDAQFTEENNYSVSVKTKKGVETLELDLQGGQETALPKTRATGNSDQIILMAIYTFLEMNCSNLDAVKKGEETPKGRNGHDLTLTINSDEDTVQKYRDCAKDFFGLQLTQDYKPERNLAREMQQLRQAAANRRSSREVVQQEESSHQSAPPPEPPNMGSPPPPPMGGPPPPPSMGPQLPPPPSGRPTPSSGMSLKDELAQRHRERKNRLGEEGIESAAFPKKE